MVDVPHVRCPKCGQPNISKEETYKGIDCVLRTSNYRCSKCKYLKDVMEMVFEDNK